MTVARDGGAKTLWKRDGGKEMVGKKKLAVQEGKNLINSASYI